MKYQIIQTSRFVKELRLAEKRGFNLEEIYTVIRKLKNDIPLDPKYRDHSLEGGKYKGCRECHINPDWLLIYKKDKNNLLLHLRRTGTHSDLF